MIKIYNTEVGTNETKEVKEFIEGSWINMVNPSEEEIEKVCTELKIEQDFIRYSLDSEEKARIDVEDDDKTVLFIIDVPITEKKDDNIIYTTMPVGIIFVRDDFIITVSGKENGIIKAIERKAKSKISKVVTYKKSQLLFILFYESSSGILNMLKAIEKKAEQLEKTIKEDQKNVDLLKLLSLEKSLVYITTSLKSDEVVMEKTLRGKVIKLYEEDEDLLEDAIIENKQAIEMSQIYSNVLNESMDVYASIISNNTNDVMKLLTSITIVLSIPTLVASIWGMNVKVPFQNHDYGFIIMIAISVVVTVASLLLLKKKNMLD